LIRALAVDIDGTLTDENRVLCPAAVEAMRVVYWAVLDDTQTASRKSS
jgi:phosphoglycolate phosphatase-like HAD superfamily hydrolase